MLMPFVVAIEPDDLEALNKVVAAGKAAEREWLAEARKKEGVGHLRGKAQSEARARVRVEFAKLRERGRLAGTRDLVLTRGIRAELKRRGMDGPYEPIPVGEDRVPGRRVGTGPGHYLRAGTEDTPLTARMAVRLPAAVGDQLVRAAYWESAPAVEALRRWQALWGDGPEVIMREAERRGGVTLLDLFGAALASRPGPDTLLEKAELQRKVITSGDVIRSAVKRAIR